MLGLAVLFANKSVQRINLKTLNVVWHLDDAGVLDAVILMSRAASSEPAHRGQLSPDSLLAAARQLPTHRRAEGSRYTPGVSSLLEPLSTAIYGA